VSPLGAYGSDGHGHYLQLLGSTADRVSDNTSSFTAALRALRYIILENGTFRLSHNFTLPKGVRLDVRPGSCISVDTGKILTVHAPLPKSSPALARNRYALRATRMFGPTAKNCAPTAPSCDEVPIQSAINAVENSFGSDCDKYQAQLACKTYILHDTVTLSPTKAINHFFDGCG
jgi:hypothetical protein